jgi:threonine/homoserine/homoserine lactone efflux protein
MPDPAALAGFVVASLVLIAIPGPDMMFVIAQGAAGGRRGGIAAGLGIASGNLFHTAFAALGASVIFRASPVAFRMLALAGAGYLTWLAFGAARAALRPAGGTIATAAPRDAAGAFGRGALMNVLNPKIALFFLAFLPPFADPARGPVWLQTGMLGLAFAVMVAVAYGPLGAMAGRAGAHLAGIGNGRAGRWGRWLLAAVYLALALRLALERL